ISDTVVIGPRTILVFLAGGSNLPILAYDTVNNSWSKRPDQGLPLKQIGDDEAFVLGADGFVYRTQGPIETRIFRYHPQDNSWEPDQVGLVPDFSASDAVALDDGTILLVGGRSTGSSTLVWFDPKSRTVSRTETVTGSFGWGGKMGHDAILLFGES